MDTSARTLRLTELVGLEVAIDDGRGPGRLRDVTVRLDSLPPRVSRMLVSRGRRLHLVPWEQVGLEGVDLSVRDGGVLGVPLDRDQLPLLEDELLLARDVLDSQVVDLEGHHLARVSEVLLAQDAEGLRAAALDLGVAALLRRLGLGALVRHATASPLEWHDVHLTSRRGHGLQLATDTATLHRLDSSGLAELLARLSTGHGADVLRRVGPARGSAALRRSHAQVSERLAHAIHGEPPPPRRRRLLRSAGWRVHRPPDPRRGQAHGH